MDRRLNHVGELVLQLMGHVTLIGVGVVVGLSSKRKFE